MAGSDWVVEFDPGQRDPWEILQAEGFTATNGFRTDRDVARIRRQGYTPASFGDHNRADAVDLDHPRLSRRQQTRRLRELFGDWEGATILDEGHHRHLALPGWGAAPGTPGTRNSGLPPIPEGFELEQRGSLSPGNFVEAAEAVPARGAISAPAAQAVSGTVEGPAPSPAPPAPSARPQGDAGGPGTTAVLPDDPLGTHVAVTADPEALRAALGQLQAAFDSGAPQGEVMALAARLGVPQVTPTFPAELNAAYRWRAANPNATQGPRFVPGEVERVRADPTEQEIIVEARRQRQPAPIQPTGELREHHPDFAERIGRGVSSLLEPAIGRYGAVEAGRNAESLLEWTPVGAADAAREYDEAYQRAIAEGRLLDAIGNDIGRTVNAAGMIPIVGPGARRGARAAGDLVRRAASRENIGEFVADTSGSVPRRAGPAASEAADMAVSAADAAPISEFEMAALRRDYEEYLAAPVGSGGFTRPGRKRGFAEFAQSWFASRRQRSAAAAGGGAGEPPRRPPPPPGGSGGGDLPPEPPDTRGQGVYFHGARGEVPELNEGYYNPANIYGGHETFYTTDAVDIARGYGRRREAARIYRVDENEPVNFYDMEEPQPVQLYEELFHVRPDDIGLVPAAIDEAAEAARGTPNLRQVMDEIRDASSAEGVSRDEVQEIFDTAIYNLRQRGFGGMTHTGGLKTGRAAHHVKIYFDPANQLRLTDETARMASGGGSGEPPRAPPPAPPGGGGGDDLPPEPPGRRQVDIIDVRNRPPGLGISGSPPIGRVRPLGEQPSAEEMAETIRSIRPEDVRPITDPNVRTLEEARRANPGTIQDTAVPDPRRELAMRSVRNASGQKVNHRGPLDAEAFLRTRGGLRDDGGDLRHIGITSNDPRPEAPGDRKLGRILNPEGMTLDEAGEALWSAGYFEDRPRIDDVVEMLRESRLGRRLYHPDDWDEVERFEAARAHYYSARAAEQEGRPLAEQVGEPIGPRDLDEMEPPATAYEELPDLDGKVGNINLAHLETGSDVRRLLRTVEQRMEGFVAARRGVQSHAETRALAHELGITEEDLLKRRQGQALNSEQILAARWVLAKSLDEVGRLAERAVGPGASDVTRAAFGEAMMTHAAIHEQVSAAITEAGRTLQALKIAASSRALSGRIHDAIIEGMGGQKRLEDIADGILELQRAGKGPGDVNRFAIKSTNPRFRDKLVELWYNSLLSGPQTHAVNILSNSMTAALQHPEMAAAAAVGHVRRIARLARGKEDDFERVMFSELGPRMVGMMQGAQEGALAFKKTLLTGEVTDYVTRVESASQRAISGLKGSVLRTPTRLLSAEDEFFKAVARRMELNGLAVRQAHKEGLKGQELRDRIADLAANPTDEMLESALDYARYLTFQTPLKGFPQDLSRWTQRQPWLKLFLPFVRTPTNIFKFAIERSPLALVLRDVRDNFKAGGARRDVAMARMALGTGLGVLIGSWAADGTITGAPPRDRALRDLLTANGWQPYSIRIGDTYYSYQRLDPLAMTLGTAADLANIGEHLRRGDADRIGAEFVASIIGSLSNKTWLSGISDLIAALDDPDRNGGNFVSRLGGSIAVPTGVAQIARTIDPIQREARAPSFDSSMLGAVLPFDPEPVLGRVQSRIPFASRSLPARRDVWGAEMTNEGGLGPDIASPIWTRRARNDPVSQELIRSRAPISRPSRTLTRDGVKYALSPESYSRYQQLSGQYIREDMQAAISDPGWRESSVEERRAEVQRIVRSARSDARDELGLYDEAEDSGEIVRPRADDWIIESVGAE